MFKLHIVLMISNLMTVTGVLSTLKPKCSKLLTLNPTSEPYLSQCIAAHILTLNLLTTTIVAPPSNASKWQMGFNSAFKWLRKVSYPFLLYSLTFPNQSLMKVKPKICEEIMLTMCLQSY